MDSCDEDATSISGSWGPSNVFPWAFVLYNLQSNVFAPLVKTAILSTLSSPLVCCWCQGGQGHLEDPFRGMLNWENDLCSRAIFLWFVSISVDSYIIAPHSGGGMTSGTADMETP